ncbi:porin family protein [Herbaspirillum sp. DW155]|uniref:outer membrane protein n=1 Tax=Herbaspirillum sp. DW155 TaxID=3095609 RepID=UPI0030885B70|nr:porin family protein [Herbaspirillum sp. DW155]
MKNNIAAAIAAIAAMMAAGSAAAQSADSGVYVGVEGGIASINAIATPTNGVKTSETNEAAALRALVGYQFNKNFAVELGYFGTDDFKQDGTNRTGTVRYNVKANVKGADLSVIYKFTEFVPGLYLKAGATRSKVSLELSQPSGTSSFSQTGTGYLVGLGYEFSVSQNVGINVGYTHFEKLGGESDNKMNLYSAGVKYKF